MPILNNEQAKLWLDQFPIDDVPTASRLLEKFVYVDDAEFASRLSQLAIKTYTNSGPVAFFIERELPMRWTTVVRPVTRRTETTSSTAAPRIKVPRRKVLRPIRMYKENEIFQKRGAPKRLRAQGAALDVVASPRTDNQVIGSEGVVATVISKLCLQYRKQFFLQPSTTKLRKFRMKHFVVVTDFIGSGTRVSNFLDSLWRVKSVRSWFNGKKITLSVLCYSGTIRGIAKVKSHASKPEVAQVIACPTLTTLFAGQELDDVKEVCMRLSPTAEDPLGYKDTGALLAFQHSCPNNVPAIFFRKSNSRRKPWWPLFPSRSATEVSWYQQTETIQDTQRRALETLKFPNVAIARAFCRATEQKRESIVVTAALMRGHRTIDELSITTSLPLWTISAAIERAQNAGFIDARWRLTRAGFAVLRKLNEASDSAAVPAERKEMYYPKLLRAPV